MYISTVKKKLNLFLYRITFHKIYLKNIYIVRITLNIKTKLMSKRPPNLARYI